MAIASTASVDGATQALRYVADPGEANRVRIMQAPAQYELEDLGVVFPGAAAPRCSTPGPYRIACSLPVSSVSLELGDQGDTVSVAFPGSVTVEGGDGNDTFSAERSGLGGGDVLRGGAGSDMADYGARAAPLQIDLDGVADDGEPGEGDNVNGDVEDVTGGAGDDRIVGNAARNHLRGESGDDQLDGGATRDVLDGGGGTDTILARDGGADSVRCGGGVDTAFVDSDDTVASDCERVLRTSVAIVGPPLLPVGPNGTVPVRLRCVAPVGKLCRGRLAITMTVWRRIPHRHARDRVAAARHRRRRTNIRLARGSFALPRGQSRPVLVRLNRAARRRLESCKRLEVQIVVVTGDAADRRMVVSRQLTLTRTQVRPSTVAHEPSERASHAHGRGCG
ncbi:MAG: calcium-binding protein [Actinomycetota bacterium]|nr:calcium-binding protein [Actinomycetota bacterium]